MLLGLVSGDGSLPGSQTAIFCLLAVSLQGGRRKGALWGLIYQSTNPIYDLSPPKDPAS